MVRDLLVRLDLIAVIDRLCPFQENKARYTHGQVIAMLVANRLTSPAPLVKVQDWAEKWAVLEIFGIEPDALNDDRCGRALEALAEQADAVVGSIAAAAIAVFGLDVSRFSWDLTSMSVYGAYDGADPDYVTPKPGRPKDHRFDLKQTQAGFATCGDGAVTLLTRVYDGGTAEIAQVEGALRALRELAGERRFLMADFTDRIMKSGALDLRIFVDYMSTTMACGISGDSACRKRTGPAHQWRAGPVKGGSGNVGGLRISC